MKKILLFAIFALAMTGCTKEKDPTPTEGLEKWVYNRQSVVDQWAPYPELQARVLDFFDKTGTMILIDFNADTDVWWAPTWVPRRVTDWEGTSSGSELLPVDKSNNGEYLKKQLDLIQDEFFDYFTTAELKEHLPQYIFLTDIVGSVSIEEGVQTWSMNPCMTSVQGNYLAFSWGGPRIDAITAEQRRALRASAVGAMLAVMAPGDKSLVTAFYAVTTSPPTAYSNAYTSGTKGIHPAYEIRVASGPMGAMGYREVVRNYSVLYKAGIVAVAPSTLYDAMIQYSSQAGATNGAPNAQSLFCVVNRDVDWSSYMTMILNTPYAELTAEPDAELAVPFYKLPSYKGIMSSTVMGSNAKIRKKYDVIINYYKRETGIDIQNFADGVKADNRQ